MVGIEDSGAGVCSIRLAGFPVIGFDGGNIEKSGTRALCNWFCGDFTEVLAVIRKLNGETRGPENSGIPVSPCPIRRSDNDRRQGGVRLNEKPQT